MSKTKRRIPAGTAKGQATAGRRVRGAARTRAARRARLRTGLVVAAALATVGAVLGVAVRSSAVRVAGTSTSVTSWRLPTLNGNGRIALASYRGKPVVVNFFASWCSACAYELPGFSTVSTELKGKVTFIGVDSLETGDKNYMPRTYHLTWWPLARDVGGANDSGLHDALGGGNSMPLTAFYSPSGKLLYVDRSAESQSELVARIAQLYGIQA